MGFGHWEILLIVFIVLLLFGGRKLPELAKGLGKGLREFKKSVKDEEDTPKVETSEKRDD